MEPKRSFLRRWDFRTITEEHLNMITENDDNRISDVENTQTVTDIIDYLKNEYEVEAALEVGYAIHGYSPQREFIQDEHVWINDKIYSIRKDTVPSRQPETEAYWELLPTELFDDEETYSPGQYVEKDGKLYLMVTGSSDDFTDDNVESETIYSQYVDYDFPDIVKYKDEWYMARVENGISSDNIVQPFTDILWLTYGAEEDIVFDDGGVYVLPEPADDIPYTVVKYGELFYELYNSTGITNATPDLAPDNWRTIEVAEYSREGAYYMTDGFNGLVLHNGTLFYLPEENEYLVNFDTITTSASKYRRAVDPRNKNLVKHMCHITLYYLYHITSPHNVPEHRIDDYKASMKWLKSASDLAINPLLDRRKVCGKNVTQWVVKSTSIGNRADAWHSL